jgi:hypothetical protein
MTSRAEHARVAYHVPISVPFRQVWFPSLANARSAVPPPGDRVSPERPTEPGDPRAAEGR